MVKMIRAFFRLNLPKRVPSCSDDHTFVCPMSNYLVKTITENYWTSNNLWKSTSLCRSFKWQKLQILLFIFTFLASEESRGPLCFPISFSVFIPLKPLFLWLPLRLLETTLLMPSLPILCFHLLNLIKFHMLDRILLL